MFIAPNQLTPDQIEALVLPPETRTFLEGPAGAGKTTVGVAWLLRLLEEGIPGGEVLLLVPQRTLAQPYYDALLRPQTPAGDQVSVVTIGGLARRMVELFWPLAAAEAGFAHPDHLPTFLTIESAQYFMAHIFAREQFFEKGFFEGLTIEHNRLYSQILDNLNKAALVGFPHTEIGPRLKAAWSGDPGQAHIYEDAQVCATRFRQFCLENNLLDFSLQLEVFWKWLWPNPICRQHLQSTYRHLIVDNLEEDVPLTADLLRDWLPHFDSALLIFDWDAGYRRFLGADPQTTYTLKDLCERHLTLAALHEASPGITHLASRLTSALSPPDQSDQSNQSDPTDLPLLYPSRDQARFFPQMLDWVTEQIDALVHQQEVPPGEIAVLAPYMSDALRFALTDRLSARGIPSYSHRPSRALQDEPAAQALLTLAALAHPQWGYAPGRFDLAYAFLQAIADLDLVRARLLTDTLYNPRSAELAPFERLKPEMQERITYRLGERYEGLRGWLLAYREELPEALDHFFSRIFGEVLSQPGYGFHVDYDAGEVAARLIESVRKFRWATASTLENAGIPLGKEYLRMVSEGVMAAQYIQSWRTPPDAVFLAPATTFLMRNIPVDYQFWLDVGSRGWHERIRQPLTHPYVLSRHWEGSRPWSDKDEYETSLESLRRLTLGLLRRCRHGVFLGLSELGEQGYEHKGLLLKALDRAMRQDAK